MILFHERTMYFQKIIIFSNFFLFTHSLNNLSWLNYSLDIIVKIGLKILNCFFFLWNESKFSQTVTDVCTLSVDPGPCQGALRRYYFDTETQQCLPFLYGGCQGNANRFRTLDECNEQCLELQDTRGIRAPSKFAV